MAAAISALLYLEERRQDQDFGSPFIFLLLIFIPLFCIINGTNRQRTYGHANHVHRETPLHTLTQHNTGRKCDNFLDCLTLQF